MANKHEKGQRTVGSGTMRQRAWNTAKTRTLPPLMIFMAKTNRKFHSAPC